MKLLPYARIVRLPNLFTAFADVVLGGLASGAGDFPGAWIFALLASGFLYSAGMVWNDIFDRDDDARHRPERPIPSGQISVRSARILGTLLVVAGLICGFVAAELRPSATAFHDLRWITCTLVAAIFAYDGTLKRTAYGPIGMGLCRALNVGLGLAAGGQLADGPSLHLMATVGLYIVGVTWFARTEETESDRSQLRFAALTLLASGLLALALPVHFPLGTSPWYFPYLVFLFAYSIGAAVKKALDRPSSRNVQNAVRRAILGLPLLDTLLAIAIVGGLGFVILPLLVPARLLVKRIAST